MGQLMALKDPEIAAVIEGLTGHPVLGWKEEEDGPGEPYWEASAHDTSGAPNDDALRSRRV